MTTWVRSSHCGNGDCLEARRVGGIVLVRDSKLGDLKLQAWTPEEWDELLSAVRARGPVADGDSLDDPSGHVAIDIWSTEVIFGLNRHDDLAFTYEEWNAFVAGVIKGEFDFDRLPQPGPSSTALDGSDEVAARRHDAATDEAGEGALTGMAPSSAVPSPPNGFSSLDSPAGQPDPAEGGRTLDSTGTERIRFAGRPGPTRHVVDVIDEALYAVTGEPLNMPAAMHIARVLVDEGMLAPEWVVVPDVDLDEELRRAAAPLVQHVPEDSSPAGGVPSGEPAARAGDATVEPDPAYTAAGGEVVPAGHRGVAVAVGTTEPESTVPAAVGRVANGAAVVEPAGRGARTPRPADSEGCCGRTYPCALDGEDW